jgi:hypothetical protein
MKGRGGWEKEEKEGEAHRMRLGHKHLHAEWKGEKEEKEGEFCNFFSQLYYRGKMSLRQYFLLPNTQKPCIINP